ncbi:hypothetical protein DEU56DRAFT_759837 [Suillus clintonianus]|uniref:uncharacterized protein n=1 Tax=Suillus clintonianus TaxID=1904413 RepID=UPI001B86E0C2|nr:uncharacterized protein DEU56DRAFT_759837 [Suillus clintonianus]KAG2124060.1 hypothetical protein DEU56DRAFT_759837 [Suillus clintonianus]
MSSTEASRRTRASNATARPGKIVLDAQTKRRTKAQKAADDLAVKEAKEAKEAAVQKGVERLAGMQVEMEKVQKELLTNKATPVRPKPKARKATKGTVKEGDNCTNSVLDDIPDADVAEDAAEPVDHGTSGKGKKAAKRSGKKLIRDAISNVQKKISESSLIAEGDGDKLEARADGKGSTPSSINTATQKFALGGRVTNWVSGVRPGQLESVSRQSSRQSSTSTRAPPTTIFSHDTASSAATSADQPRIQTKIPLPPTQVADCIPDDDLTGGFADEIDDSLEREAACLDSKQKKGKSKVASIFDEDSDCGGPKAPFTQIPPIEFDSDDELMDSFTQEDEDLQEPEAPFTQMDDHIATAALKRKASVDSISDNDEQSQWSMDIDRDNVEDLIEDSDSEPPQANPIVVKKEKVLRMTTSTSATTSNADIKPPAPKKVKVESSGTPHAQAQAPARKRQQNVDTAPEHMKSRGAYRTADLPPAMQADQRWAKTFLPTIMMWAGTYEDIWSIPDDVLLHHVQLVFNVVYHELKIAVVHGGVVHLLTAQRISEWRSNFGSTAIVIIVNFLARNTDCNSSELASSLLASWAFLYEDPDNINPLTAYRSPFILQLYGRAHLSAINGYVEVPSLDLGALATTGTSRVLALSAAALERALGMFSRKELNLQEILLSASRGKFTIKLPKVLNKATGKKTNAPFLFSAARWSKATNSYLKSISSKPTGYVEATVKMARAILQDVAEIPGSLNDYEEDEDERAMICKFYLLDFVLPLTSYTTLLQDLSSSHCTAAAALQ